MRIKCPYCGERSLDEFAFHGDASKPRPNPSTATTDEFYEYAYERANVAGSSDEYWQHIAGCRAWLIVRRDNRTHAIEHTTAAREAVRAEVAATSKVDGGDS